MAQKPQSPPSRLEILTRLLHGRPPCIFCNLSVGISEDKRGVLEDETGYKAVHAKCAMDRDLLVAALAGYRELQRERSELLGAQRTNGEVVTHRPAVVLKITNGRPRPPA
jgi:hypothetical protein